ncbi:MAG: hypothetical protein AAGE52_37745 [Myxococcota bacterium]
MTRLATLLVLVFTLAFPATGAARRSDMHAYRMEQVWSTVVRLLRVDYGFPIRDRDRDIGYLLFDYPHGQRTVPGSLELVPAQAHGQTQVRVTLSIPAMPAYIERMILDKLERKLREDHGRPLPPPRARPEPEENDDDEDEDEEGDEAER